MTANNNTSSGSGSGSDMFGRAIANAFANYISSFGTGVPLNQLRQAGQSEASSAEDNLALQQKYADQAANSNYNTALRSREQGSNIDTNAYQQKQAIDTQAASDRLHNQLNQQSQAPGSSSFAGYQDGIYNYNPQIGGPWYSPTVTYNQTLSPQVGLLREQDRLNQADANNNFNKQLALSDRQRYNQQNLANAQYSNQANLNASQYASQENLANIDAQSRVASATIGAQGGLLGSLFGSFGNNSSAGRYW